MGEGANNPCRLHGCHACCVDTRMTLTEEDLERLRERGERRFYVLESDGTVRLRTVGGRCVFLRHGVCSVYSHRPEGCRLYPLVLDVGADRVVPDVFCPFHEEFDHPVDAEERLRASVAAETREAQARRGR